MPFQEIEDYLVGFLRRLGEEAMPHVLDGDELSVGYLRGKEPRVFQRNQLVSGPGDDQSWSLDLGQPVIGIVAHYRLRLPHVAVRRGDIFHRLRYELFNDIWVVIDELLATEEGKRFPGCLFWRQPLHTLYVEEKRHRLLVGHGGVATSAGGAPQDEAVHPLWVAKGELLGDHASHGDAIDMGGIDSQRVKESGDVLSEHLHGIGYIRLVAPSGAPVVEGDHAVLSGEARNLAEPLP